MEKKYDHLASEAAAQKQWNDHNTYAMKNNPGTTYTIDTPPPTVSGKLHIGHIFSYTQTDIIARYKRMSGYSVFYPFGFDDNGLATERFVEKKLHIKGHELPRSEFIGLCIKESLEAANQFKELWQKMGLSIDWSLVYSTMSDSTRALSQKSFIELYKKNFIYRQQEPALYCATCRTSVAQAELDDKEMPSLFNDIVFKDTEGGHDLIIATTRPELLPACAAILYNPADDRYKHLKGKHAKVPLFGHEVPIIEDELVEIEKGTGLVMVCTFGDKTDIIWYKKHHLPYRQIIGFDGKCTDNAGFLQGMTITNARTAVLEKLKEEGLLLNQKPINHSVNTHERCKKEIEFVIIPQWFISILHHKKAFLSIADEINWHPSFMKARYNDWVENLAWDWGISRQRFYGIPFPVWHCKDCKAIILADENQLPVDPQETAYNSPCPQCTSTNIAPDTDVMDTWNTSSLTPYICQNLYIKNTNPLTLNSAAGNYSSPLTLNSAVGNYSSPLTLSAAEGSVSKGSFLPMDMRPQAHDIIRTWAFDTIVKAWMHDDIMPWKDIVISGHVLSDKKEKISKKDGNGMEPEKLLAQYPADAIRYWTASAKLGHDIAFSDEQLLIGQKLITKLWNAFKFAQPHLETFDTPHNAPANIGAVNEWLLHTITICFEKYTTHLTQQEPSLALNVIEQFFWNDYCDNYIELTKNQLFNPDEYPADDVYATKWTLYHVGLRILQMYAPYLPHVTETIYQSLYKHHEQVTSIHQTRYNDTQKFYVFAQQAELVSSIITITSQVRKLKSEKQLSLKTPLAKLYIFTDKNDSSAIAAHDQLIRGITQAVAIDYLSNSKENKAEIREVNNEWHAWTNKN